MRDRKINRGKEDDAGHIPSSPRKRESLWNRIRKRLRDNRPTDQRTSDSWHIDFKDVVLILAVYSYFVGFLYTYFLYGNLGLPLMSLDIPVYYFFVYSYSVVVDPRVIAVLICAALTAFLVSGFVPRSSTIRTAVLILVCSLLFPILSLFTRRIAETDANRFRQGYSLKPIGLSFKDTSPNRYPAELQDPSGRCQLYLLTENKDKVFVICQPSASRDVPNRLPIGHVYEIAKEDLTAIQVEIPDEQKR